MAQQLGLGINPLVIEDVEGVPMYKGKPSSDDTVLLAMLDELRSKTKILLEMSDGGRFSLVKSKALKGHLFMHTIEGRYLVVQRDGSIGMCTDTDLTEFEGIIRFTTLKSALETITRWVNLGSL